LTRRCGEMLRAFGSHGRFIRMRFLCPARRLRRRLLLAAITLGLASAGAATSGAAAQDSTIPAVGSAACQLDPALPNRTTGPGPGGQGQVWRWDVNSDGLPDVAAVDINGDGQPDAVGFDLDQNGANEVEGSCSGGTWTQTSPP
jgi:hypothetical protein